ncbi:MAG: NADPH:quinone oxidoreductase family protein [Hyphomicrobiales bacterium]|nr:NADPH:quinone oxidoreductase family protein [Hyphomicrobiales bacterium]
MRAIICTALGTPPRLALVDLPDPIAGEGQVLVRIAAAGVNYPDLLMTRGEYQHKPTLPFIPGLEAVGVIETVGAGVATTLLGRRVAISHRTGCFADRIAASVSAVVMTVPDDWSDEEAAAFPVAARTAHHALVQKAQIGRGDIVAITGASGGTGHMAIMLAKDLGARVVAVTGSEAKRAALLSLGADAVVVANDTRTLADEVKSASGGRGVDVIFDPVGGDVLEAMMRATAWGARVCVVGFTAGGATALRSNYILIKGLSVLGIRAGESAARDPRLAIEAENALPAMAARGLRPLVGARFELRDVARAFDAMRSRSVVGKVALQCTPT